MDFWSADDTGKCRDFHVIASPKPKYPKITVEAVNKYSYPTITSAGSQRKFKRSEKPSRATKLKQYVQRADLPVKVIL